jgi:septum formation protein
VLESLIMSQLVLASGSPRRREMLAWMGLEFMIKTVDADETPLPGESPAAYVSRLAEVKAKAAVNHNVIGSGQDPRTVIAADTTVADGNDILGKPGSAEEAQQMLRRLRGRAHQVFTALAVFLPGVGWLYDICRSEVPMRQYSDEEIETYVASGDPMDKAGAYAIQNRAFKPVTGFSGCFANVMGLPLCNLTRTLRKAGMEPPVNVPLSCQQNLSYACPVYQAILAGRDIG